MKTLGARIGVVLLAVAMGMGCTEEESCPGQTPWWGPPALASVPETLAVCRGRYSLKSYLWRDFMPVSSPDGDPLRAVISLVEVDSLLAPAELDLEHLWAIADDRFWSTEFNAERVPGAAPFEVARVARCGPKWPPGISVDVVVTLRCGDEQPRYLKVLNVPIHRTE